MTGANSDGHVTFVMPDIGDNGAEISSIEIKNLEAIPKGYNITFTNSVMKIYSDVAAHVNGEVDLSGKTADTDGIFEMKGNTGYYAEIIPPTGATSYVVESYLFGTNGSDQKWGFHPAVNEKANLITIMDLNNKIIGFHFHASQEDIDFPFLTIV